MRVGCVFSESLNDRSLGRFAEAPPGASTATETQGAQRRSTKHEPTQSSPANRISRIVLNLLQGTRDDLVATLFPGDCRLCNGPLTTTSSLPVCELCLVNLRSQSETHPGALCRICGERLGFENESFLAGRAEEQVCTPCRRVPPAFDRAAAFGVYSGELRELISLFKFNGLRHAAATLGPLLAQTIAQLPLDLATETLLIPVPLLRAKTRARGFNQAELLAASALRYLRLTHPRLRLAPGLLTRVKATKSQFGLNPRQRRDNLRGAFAIPDVALIEGRDILVIDDIYTTGATARACAAVLRRAGARHIFIATLSRAQTDTVALWDNAALSTTGVATGRPHPLLSNFSTEGTANAVGKNA